MTPRLCRSCAAPLRRTFCDLGMSPLANSYRSEDQLREMEPTYPLHAFVCERCFLVQLEAFETPEAIFGDYAYFSSYADSWLAHSEKYAALALARERLSPTSFVVEVASNDGYLLQYFQRFGVPVLGVEPAANVARVAREKGVPTDVAFFGVATAQRLLASHKPADLIVANNVLAHVPDIHDFVGGMSVLLSPRGIVTIEFPHLARQIEQTQFDTIYHEHFSYLSLLAIEPLVATHGLRVVRVEELPTHGGSLRVSLARADDPRLDDPSVEAIRAYERICGLHDLATYDRFAQAVARCKAAALRFLIDLAAEGKTIAGYGAPAKGNTFLNYCGVGRDLLPYTVDRNVHKQHHYLPGLQIPIEAPEVLLERKPDYVLILPWNIKDEVMEQMSAIAAYGGKFVIAVPTVTVLN